MGGTLTLSYSGGSTMEIGTVTTIQESLQKSCAVTPLVSMPITDTFAVESRCSKVINISFKRNSSDWSTSNASWIRSMERALDRWQCRTDGFKLRYEADPDNPYIAEINENGYVKSFIYRYSSGSPEVVEGSIEFHVGTMYCGSQARHNSDGVDQEDFFLSISDVNRSIDYTLIGNGLDNSYVESYTLCGGPQSPFEYMTITVPRNRLSELAPALTAEGGIVAGRNRVVLRGIGNAEMTVTKCKLRNNKYTITAYCDADVLRGTTLTSIVSGTPSEVIQIILNGNYGVTYTTSRGNLIMDYESDSEAGTLAFPQGRNAWYALQVAAMCMGCMIFFANNRAYVIDYRQDNPSNIDECGDIDLYPDYGNVSMTTQTASLGDEGTDTIVNIVQYRAQVSVLDENGNPTYTDHGEGAVPRYTANTELDTGIWNGPGNEDSVAMFKERTSNLISLEDLLETEPVVQEVPPPEGSPEGTEPTYETIIPGYSQASAFAKNYVSYRDEPQQSIEYTVKEMFDTNSGPRWSPMYLPASRADSIYDSADMVTISNKSEFDGSAKYQKLFLSNYERHYPQGTTTYTWGVMASIDLSSSTSQIMTSLDNS